MKSAGDYLGFMKVCFSLNSQFYIFELSHSRWTFKVAKRLVDTVFRLSLTRQRLTHFQVLSTMKMQQSLAKDCVFKTIQMLPEFYLGPVRVNKAKTKPKSKLQVQVLN